MDKEHRSPDHLPPSDETQHESMDPNDKSGIKALGLVIVGILAVLVVFLIIARIVF